MPAIHRRPVVKAPASKAAKAGKSSAAAKTAKAATARKPAAKAPAKVAAKKAPAKAAKAPVKATAKAPAKAAAKPAPKAAAPKAAKPAAKTVKPVAKAPAPRPAAKAPAKPVASAKSAAARAASALINKVAAAPAPAPVAPVAAPRPVSKRDARKAMLEQMTQAEVVPTHAPDAAKATFSNTIERTVMTPPVPTSLQKDPKRANNWKTLSVEQLTDQDVLAMPDGEYMNDQQLAFFRLKLQRLKADMLANAGETTEHLREDTVVVPDPADRATIEEEHALELRTRDRERKLLKKIEQAIARIDSGDYGYCEETGEPIGVGRLMARPTASLSLEAQQRRELKQKMFGD
ncbi:MAG: RNA polymerase-binding protein DksA [Hydrogenophaga sp.]|nr:RNA polymerase-binding protein DksA [Hydrogenophaga sp.]